jgi:hypothetical protein
MCSPVMALWEEDAKVAVTRLDRARGFPPLSVDAEDPEAVDAYCSRVVSSRPFRVSMN